MTTRTPEECVSELTDYLSEYTYTPHEAARLIKEIQAEARAEGREEGRREAWEDGYGFGWDDGVAGKDANERPNPYKKRLREGDGGKK